MGEAAVAIEMSEFALTSVGVPEEEVKQMMGELRVAVKEPLP